MDISVAMKTDNKEILREKLKAINISVKEIKPEKKDRHTTYCVVEFNGLDISKVSREQLINAQKRYANKQEIVNLIKYMISMS